VLTLPYVFAWLRALAFTQIIEAPITRRMLGVSWWKALAPSFVTHPFVWFAFPRLADRGVPYAAWVAVAEITVWVVEAAMLARLARAPWTRAALASLVANGVSLSFGLVANELFGGI
jgi:hypothetical protein